MDVNRSKGAIYRTAVVRAPLTGRDRRKAFDLVHRTGLLYSALAEHSSDVYRETGEQISRKDALRWAAETLDSDLLRMHAHTKQGVYERLLENIQTALTNMGEGREGACVPHRHKNYMPATFTKDFGWRIRDDRLVLSLGRQDGRIQMPVPEFTDARTGLPVPPQLWGEIELCWDRSARQWRLHIAYRTRHDLPELDPERIVAIDEGIINPMTIATETDTGYEVTVINGRAARAIKHRRNKAVSATQKAKSHCRKGSRRWRKLDRAEKRARASADRGLRNTDHQVSRKVADFVTAHHTGRIVAGDVRGIEQNTRKAERRRAGRHQRRRLSQWSRGRQERYLTEKTNTEVEHIPEDYSSRTCPACNTRNRPHGRNYQCHACGFVCHRDAVGALNILQRARYGSYQPIDPNKPVQVTYLRAVPLITARSTAKMQATAHPGCVVQESEVPYPTAPAA